MKKVIITGGSGFIGSEIVRQLYLTKDWDITVIDVMSEKIHGRRWKNSYLYKQIENKCHFVYGNICDLDLIQETIVDNEYIIHLAAETGTGQSMYQINEYNKTNIMGTSNILQAISNMGKASKVKKIILSSSRSVYGEGKYVCVDCGTVYPKSRKKEKMQMGDFNMYCPYCGNKLQLVKTSEDSNVNPTSLYAFTKLAQEMLLKTMCPAMGIDYTIFRFQNVYGVGQSLKNPYTGILSVFSSLMMENKPINVFEDGLESRDFINVIDVARGVISALDIPSTNSEIINLGSGIGTSVIEIASILKRIYHSSSIIKITEDFRLGDIANNIADIEKAKNILGFHQTISLDNGLAKFCDWVKQQEYDNSGYENSLNEMENSGMFIRK